MFSFFFLANRNEKSFEHAALTIYRQRNFFDRWRHKSISCHENDTSATGSGNYEKVIISAPPPFRSNSNDSNACMSSSPQETARNTFVTRPNDQAPARRIRAPAPFADFSDSADMETEFEIMDNAIRQQNSRDCFISNDNSSGSIKNYKKETVESFVQTGEELLDSLISGLRRRKISKDLTNAPHISLSHNNTGHSALHKRNSNGNTSGTNIIMEPSSSFNLGANGHLQTNCCALSSNQDVSDISPLLKSGMAEFDSPSEETLSEKDPFVDIDDLLMDVEPHRGSFSSTLKGSKSSKQSLSETSSSPPPLSPLVKEILPSGHTQHINNNQTSFQHTRNDPGLVMADVIPQTSGNSAAAMIPHILVERASHSSGDYSAMSRDSGRPSDSESRRPSFLSNCDNKSADRTSAELSSIEDFSMYSTSINRSDSSSGTEHSVFGKSSSGDPIKKDSVTEFQEYLKTKGLQLDMNSVQSSEV